MRRRSFLQSAGASAGAAVTAAVGGLLPACSSAARSDTSGRPHAPPLFPGKIRVASVVVPVSLGLMKTLADDFAVQVPGAPAVVANGSSSPLQSARDGEADLVICHLGHTDDPSGYDLQAFIAEGHGRWPVAVFSNQALLLGVGSDPAGIAGVQDLTIALSKIAASGSVLVANHTDWLPYLADTIAQAAGLRTGGSWYLDTGAKGQDALTQAQVRNGYTLWGGGPFLTASAEGATSLVPYVHADPSLLRMMVSVVVDPASIRGVNAAGAARLQEYFLTPRVQGMVRTFRPSGTDFPSFWPSGGQNNPFTLPADRPPSS